MMADPARWLTQLHPRDLERGWPIWRAPRPAASRSPPSFDTACDGRVVWFRDEAVVVRNEAGQPLYLQGSCRYHRAQAAEER
jgi:hypothetical protein